MVEKKGEALADTQIETDWVSVYEGWKDGHSAKHLSRRFGITAELIECRCSWLDQHLTPGTPQGLMAHFSRELDEARKVLDGGDGVDAERRAKALIALVKAARALEDWTLETSKTSNATPANEGHDYDPRAELERRLLDYAERERKAQLAADAYAGSSASKALGVEDLGTEKPASS